MRKILILAVMLGLAGCGKPKEQQVTVGKSERPAQACKNCQAPQ